MSHLAKKKCNDITAQCDEGNGKFSPHVKDDVGSESFLHRLWFVVLSFYFVWILCNM